MKKFNRYIQFLVVIIAAGSIYPLIFLRTAYQETILYVFDMNITQLNMIYTLLGLAFTAGYFPSGYLSDRFSPKWLLVVSLFCTGLAGFWFAQIPNFISVVWIFCIWGFFSVFTFWSAHMKLVKMLSKPREEGIFFGILDGGRGIVEAILAAIALFLFSQLMTESPTNSGDPQAALQAVIYMYSVVMILVSGLIAAFLDSDYGGSQLEKSEKLNFAPIFKDKMVYILSIIIFMGYFVFWSQFFIGGHLEVNFGVPPVDVAAIMFVFIAMRPFGGILGGILATKIDKSKVLGFSMLMASFCLMLFAVLPTNISIYFFYITLIVAALFIFCVRGVYWSLIGDLDIDNKSIGSTIGYISLFAYLPDILAPLMLNLMFDTFGSQGGYNVYFTVITIFGLLGALFCLVFKNTLITQKIKNNYQLNKLKESEKN
ncbi:MAG: MFS transporter [Defluviitaleaceae bacterium]|nr:MFS transporter [Defluviitaleaceae bacterium]